MGIVRKPFFVVTFILYGVSHFVSASALSQDESAETHNEYAYTPSMPYTIIDRQDILSIEQMSEYELLARFITNQDDENLLMPLYAYSVDKICENPDSSVEQGETDWFQKLWAEQVKEVGVVAVIPDSGNEVAVIPNSGNKEKAGEQDKLPPLSADLPYSDNGRINQDNLCDSLKRISSRSNGDVLLENSDYVAIPYPYVDRDYNRRFFLRTQLEGLEGAVLK